MTWRDFGFWREGEGVEGLWVSVEAVKFMGWRWWQLAVENGYILDQM